MEYFTDDEDFLNAVDEILQPNNPRNYHDRPNYMEQWDNIEFLQRYRLSKETVSNIADAISADISTVTQR